MSASMPSVRVLFADPKYNYQTSMSVQTTEQDARDYFVGARMDMGIFPVEDMQTPIGIEYTAGS